jgi:iron complex outermembrane receptor protein
MRREDVMARKQICTALRLGTALIALAAAPAFAQSAEQEASQANEARDQDLITGAEVSEGPGEIVVTARRRAESLVDVPIAVTAYSGEALEAQGALDITDIADTTPNVTLEVSRGTNTTLSAFIRGVGQQDPVAGFEQGVGIYLDDVYLNRPQAAVLDIYDVERIEVLRGPQGTLYGRNTIGGAVKYVTRRISRDPQLRLRTNLGSDQLADLIVSASSAVGEAGVLRLGGSIARLTRDGFGRNLTTGQDNYNRDIFAGRLSVEVNNENNIFVRLSGDYTKDNSNARGGHRLIPGYASGAPVLENVFDTRGGLNTPEQEVKAYGFSLFGEAKLSDLFTVRSITAFRKDDSSTPIDFDALPAADLDVAGLYNNKQVSQELQLLFGTDRLNILVGGYFLDASADTPFDVRLFTTVPGFSAFTSASVDTETFAVFGDATFDLTEQISFSGGARYTWDKREATILRQNFLGGGSTLFGGAGIPFGLPSTNFSGERTFKKFTPRASVSFKPAPNQNIYASYSKGFKGGGFDPRGVGVNAPDLNGNGTKEPEEIAAFLSFKPETVDSYEVGYKGSIFDRRLNFAIAAFHADYSDVQIPGSSGCTVNGVQTFCGVVTNAGKARFRGVEVEASGRLVESMAVAGDRLTLAGSLGYIDAEYREYVTNIAGRGPVDVARFREVQNTPKWTASGTLGYEMPMEDGRLNFNTTVSYRSKTFQFEIPNPLIDQPGYALWDASLVYRADNDLWSIGLHGKNLTDKEYKTSGYTFLAANPETGELLRAANGRFVPTLGREGTLTAFYGNPRQVFVSLGLNF